MTRLEGLVTDLKRLNAGELLLLAEGKPAFVLAVSAEGKVGKVEPQVVAPEGTSNLAKSAAMGRGLAALFSTHRIQGYVLLTHCWLVTASNEEYRGATQPEDIPMDDRAEHMLLIYRMQGAPTTFETCRLDRVRDRVTRSQWAEPESDSILQAVNHLAVPDW